jgi:hypothetical protein
MKKLLLALLTFNSIACSKNIDPSFQSNVPPQSVNSYDMGYIEVGRLYYTDEIGNNKLNPHGIFQLIFTAKL